MVICKRLEARRFAHVEPAERDKYLKAAYRPAELANKPRNFIGMAKDIPPALTPRARKVADLVAEIVTDAAARNAVRP